MNENEVRHRLEDGGLQILKCFWLHDQTFYVEIAEMPLYRGKPILPITLYKRVKQCGLKVNIQVTPSNENVACALEVYPLVSDAL